MYRQITNDLLRSDPTEDDGDADCGLDEYGSESIRGARERSALEHGRWIRLSGIRGPI